MKKNVLAVCIEMKGDNMNIANNKGDFECKTKQELEAVIRESALNPYDDIWISERAGEYPCLTILVNGDYACVHYFLNDKGDMWQSVGNAEDDTVFASGGGEPDFSPFEATISLEKAIECMNIFFDTHQRPACIEWREL